MRLGSRSGSSSQRRLMTAWTFCGRSTVCSTRINQLHSSAGCRWRWTMPGPLLSPCRRCGSPAARQRRLRQPGGEGRVRRQGGQAADLAREGKGAPIGQGLRGLLGRHPGAARRSDPGTHRVARVDAWWSLGVGRRVEVLPHEPRRTLDRVPRSEVVGESADVVVAEIEAAIVRGETPDLRSLDERFPGHQNRD